VAFFVDVSPYPIGYERYQKPEYRSFLFEKRTLENAAATQCLRNEFAARAGPTYKELHLLTRCEAWCALIIAERRFSARDINVAVANAFAALHKKHVETSTDASP
jgi:hypothetical protein